MSMHIPSMAKIHWNLLKLSSGKKNTDGRQTDAHTDDQRETIIPRHYRVAGYINIRNRSSVEVQNKKMTPNFQNFEFCNFPFTSVETEPVRKARTIRPFHFRPALLSIAILMIYSVKSLKSLLATFLNRTRQTRLWRFRPNGGRFELLISIYPVPLKCPKISRDMTS